MITQRRFHPQQTGQPFSVGRGDNPFELSKSNFKPPAFGASAVALAHPSRPPTIPEPCRAACILGSVLDWYPRQSAEPRQPEFGRYTACLRQPPGARDLEFPRPISASDVAQRPRLGATILESSTRFGKGVVLPFVPTPFEDSGRATLGSLLRISCNRH
jgi:hypothetical protein